MHTTTNSLETNPNSVMAYAGALYEVVKTAADRLESARTALEDSKGATLIFERHATIKYNMGEAEKTYAGALAISEAHLNEHLDTYIVEAADLALYQGVIIDPAVA